MSDEGGEGRGEEGRKKEKREGRKWIKMIFFWKTRELHKKELFSLFIFRVHFGYFSKGNFIEK